MKSTGMLPNKFFNHAITAAPASPPSPPPNTTSSENKDDPYERSIDRIKVAETDKQTILKVPRLFFQKIILYEMNPNKNTSTNEANPKHSETKKWLRS